MSLDLTFKSIDVDVVAPRVEAIVRADVGAAEPLAYTLSDVMPKKSAAAGLGSFVKISVSGGQVTPLMTVGFELGPRPAQLRAAIGQLRSTSFVGALGFLIPIRKPVLGEVTLGTKGLMATPVFIGGPQAEALNNVPGLAKRAEKSLVAKATIGLTLKQTPEWRLFSTPEGSFLLVRTLPVVTAMKLTTVAGTTNAGEILAIADAIEAAL